MSGEIVTFGDWVDAGATLDLAPAVDRPYIKRDGVWGEDYSKWPHAGGFHPTENFYIISWCDHIVRKRS
jgi:hypothetical protein